MTVTISLDLSEDTFLKILNAYARNTHNTTILEMNVVKADMITDILRRCATKDKLTPEFTVSDLVRSNIVKNVSAGNDCIRISERK